MKNDVLPAGEKVTSTHALHTRSGKVKRDAGTVTSINYGIPHKPLPCLRADGDFFPAFLLVLGVLHFWETLRRHTRTQAALMGVNAAVVGVLLTTLYHPVGTGAMHAPVDPVFELATLVALMRWKWPPWLVVVCSAAAGWWLYA